MSMVEEMLRMMKNMTIPEKDIPKSKKYFDLCLQFCNQNKAYETGYYYYTLLNLMQIADEEKNVLLATEYANKIKEYAPKDHTCYKAAKEYLKKHPSKEKKGFFSIFGF